MEEKTKLLTFLTLLLCCRDHNTIPRFLQFHHYIHCLAANRIYQCTSFALLWERIHQIRRELDITSRNLLNIHLHIANILSESDWSLINQLTLNKALRVGENSKERQLKKFTRLHKKQHPTTRTTKETVINLNDQKLDDAMHSLLQKGLNLSCPFWKTHHI